MISPRRKSLGLLATVNIAGTEVRIYRTKEQVIYEGSPCLGLFDPEEQTIHIWAGLSDVKEREVLIHELTHAALCYFHHEEMPGPLEERLCDIMGSALASGLLPWLKPITKKRGKNVPATAHSSRK